MFEIIIIAILALFALGGIWAFVVSRKVKKEGIETDAVVSRIELHESGNTTEAWEHSNVSEEYYITYTDQDGQSVEAMLIDHGSRTFQIGDRVRIKYLPDRKDYPIFISTL